MIPESEYCQYNFKVVWIDRLLASISLNYATARSPLHITDEVTSSLVSNVSNDPAAQMQTLRQPRMPISPTHEVTERLRSLGVGRGHVEVRD